MKVLLCVIVIFFILTIVFLIRIAIFFMNRTEEEIDKVKKEIEFYDILVKWVELKQKTADFSTYFTNNGYKTAAIYGMKELGKLLLEELNLKGINVIYAIDKNADEIDTNIEVVMPSKNMKKTDVIIVTAPHYYNDIYTELQDYTNAEIVSIEDLLWSI